MKTMNKSAASFFSPCRRTLFIFGVVVFLAASGFVTESTNAQGRVIRATFIATSSSVESQVEIRILLDSQGNEASTSFSLNFNPFVFTNPVVTRGSDVPFSGSNLAVNIDNLAQGQLGILVNSPNTFAAGTRNIINVRFTIPARATLGIHPITFGGVPTPQSVLNSTREPLPTTYEQGGLSIGTADGIGVSGRIFTPDGRGLGNVTVIATDTFGNRRFATTSSFGVYVFSYVKFGWTYTFTVQSKRYRFVPRVIPIVFPLPDFDFVGQE